MKVKKDKFLTVACADLDLETATRENYGFKSKGSTATGATYTIAPRAHVGGRMQSARRRGFIHSRPTSEQKGTQGSNKDPLRAPLAKAQRKSDKSTHSYNQPKKRPKMSLAELADIPSMSPGEINAFEEAIRSGRPVRDIKKWLNTMRKYGDHDLNRARAITDDFFRDVTTKVAGEQASERRQVRDELAQRAARERMRPIMEEMKKSSHIEYVKGLNEPMEARKREAAEQQARTAKFTQKPIEAPTEPSDDISGITDASNNELEQMKTSTGAFSIMQWIAEGNAGKYAQDFLNAVQTKEKGDWEARRRGLGDVFMGKAKTVPYAGAPKEWPWPQIAPAMKADIIRHTQGKLTPQQQQLVFNILSPQLDPKEQSFFGFQKRLSAYLDTPEGRNTAATLTSDPLKSGANFVWGSEGAKERDEKLSKAEEISNMFRDRKRGGLRFNRSLSDRIRQSAGEYGRTQFDEDISSFDDDEGGPISWEGKSKGQQPTKEFEAETDPSRYFSDSVVSRLRNPSAAQKINGLMRREMNRPEIRHQADQLAAAKDRSGELVNRPKIAFMLAYQANPDLQMAVDENLDGGPASILQSFDTTFQKDNAQLMADPTALLDPANQDLTGSNHIRNYRRYLTLLRRSFPKSRGLSAEEKLEQARLRLSGKGMGANDSESRNRLDAYRYAATDAEGKLWQLHNQRQMLALQYQDAVKKNASDQALELIEQKLDANDKEHYSLMNSAHQQIRQFAGDPKTPGILNRLYSDPSALKNFAHPDVKQGMTSPDSILRMLQKSYEQPYVSQQLYSKMYPDRAKGANERAEQAKARRWYANKTKDQNAPADFGVSSDFDERIKRLDTKRAFDRLPDLLRKQYMLNRYLIFQPSANEKTQKYIDEAANEYGQDLTPFKAMHELDKVKADIDNIKSIAPRSEYEKYLTGVSGMSDTDKQVMVGAIFPGGYFGEYQPPAVGGVMSQSSKAAAVRHIKESAQKEGIVKRAREMYYDIIRQAESQGTGIPVKYHDVLQLVGMESRSNALKNVRQAYVDAAISELPKEYQLPEARAQLQPGQDGTSFTYTGPDGKEVKIPYAGQNLSYAHAIDNYTKMPLENIYNEIKQLSNKKQQEGGVLDPESNMRLNMGKLLYSVMNDEDKGVPQTPLDNELYLIGHTATGNPSQNESMHDIWKRLLPTDERGLVQRAIENNVAPEYYQWSKYRGTEPQENQDVVPGFIAPSELAAIQYQRGKRNETESPETTMQQHQIAQQPPKDIYGNVPRPLAAPQSPVAPGVKLGEIGSKPKVKQTTLPQTSGSAGEYADAADLFLATAEYRSPGRYPGGKRRGANMTGAKEKFFGQGGEGSGEGMQAVLGAPHRVHALDTFMRRGAKKKMQNLAPQNQMAMRIGENVVEQTNAKNNIPGQDLTMRRKPGSFAGQRPYSILHKMLITPKDLKIDGGLGE